MATVTSAVAANTSSSNTSSYASSSFTPAVGDLLVVSVVASDTVAAGTMTGTGAGLTFSKVGSGLFQASAGTAYVFVANAFVSAASAQTVTFSCAGDNATGCAIWVARVAGAVSPGLGGVRSSLSLNNQGSGSLFSFTTSAATLLGNPLIAVGGFTAAPTLTPDAAWAEQVDTSYATPTTGIYASTCAAGQATTSHIPSGGIAPTAWGGVMVEIDAMNRANLTKLRAYPQLLAH